MNKDVISELAPNGTLRAGINLLNPLLVTGKSANGNPEGVSPDMALEMANQLGVAVSYVTFGSPGEVADAIAADEWDIALIAAEPARAETIAFSKAYVEIEATYMVAESSNIRSIADVDRPGIRIAVSDRSAYDLYLSRNLENAELVRGKGLAGTVDLFLEQKLDALAGLRPALTKDAEKHAGMRILNGQFTAVQQAIGTNPENTKAAAFIEAFIVEAKRSGLVSDLIEKHGVTGRLQVAAV